MGELSDAIEKHIGVRVLEDTLNHYSLLGLKVNATPREIKQALRTAIAAWNSSDTKSDPAPAQRVATLIKQAQVVLLDSARKLEYDKQFEARAMPIDYSFLPTGDPFASFDPSESLVGACSNTVASAFGSVDQRWAELCRQIPALGHSIAETVVAVHRSESNRATPQEFGTSFANKPKDRGASAAARIERLKRKRKMTQRLYVAGFLAFAAVFLAYAGIRFVWNRQQIAQNPWSDAMGMGKSTLVESGSRHSGGKNTLEKNASDPAFVLPSLDKNDSSNKPGVEFTNSNPFGTVPTVTHLESSPAVSDVLTPSSDAKQSEQVSMIPVRQGASKSEWIDAMTKARAAVNKTDFSTFHYYMKVAFALSSSEEMVSKQVRLDQLGLLYEIFISSIREAKTKLNGAETILVGKSQIIIVEFKEDQLIVKIQGKTEQYAWDRVPPGIAMALADLTLSDREPVDIAARAVYCSLSPARNQLFEKRVKDWFEKSVGKGTIRKDLVQALTDTYD
ncbi:MAG TPA: J domain-containing protein [Pirellula sp.]|nr:J domain-containing protein [Pirellula sp.]